MDNLLPAHGYKIQKTFMPQKVLSYDQKNKTIGDRLEKFLILHKVLK